MTALAAPLPLTLPRWRMPARRRLGGRWWRRVLGHAMAGETWVDVDGHVLVDADGYELVCDDCPCEGCPASIDITLSLDSQAKCCLPPSTNISRDWRVTSSYIDGTYNRTLVGSGGALCQYGSNFPVPQPVVADVDRYNSFDQTCSGGVISSSTLSLCSMTLNYDRSANLITFIQAWIKGGNGTDPMVNRFCNVLAFSYDRNSDGGSYEPGDTIPSTYSSCGGGVYAGGTAVAVFPS